MTLRRLTTSPWLWGSCLVACLGYGAFWATDPGQLTPPGAPRPPAAKKPPGEHADLKMDRKQREYLWQLEHHGNLLSKYGFKPLAAALVAGDEASLRRLLTADFRGSLLEGARAVSLHTPVADVVRRSRDVRPAPAAGAKEVLEELLGYRRPFKHRVQAKLAVMSLTPSDLSDFERPWDGTAQLRLWGETAPGKPREVVAYLKLRVRRPSETLSRGAWLSACDITQDQVASSERYLMREVAAERGLDAEKLDDQWKNALLPRSWIGAFLCDFDRDGLLDVLIVDGSGYYLYRGLPGGKFRDVTKEVGLPRRPTDDTPRGSVAAFVDLDGDGWEDLILGNQVFRNMAGKEFRDVRTFSPCNLRLHPGTTGVAVADFDRDGRMDLYTFQTGRGETNSWLEGKCGPDHPDNRLWRNKGNWQFEDVTSKSGTDGGSRSTFTAVWLDADNDGWPDLFVPNEFGPGVLYVNRRDGTFRPHALGKGPTDFGTMGVTAGDIDNDGNIDLYCANMYSKAGSRVIGNMRPGTYPGPIMAQIRSFVKGSELHHNLGGLRFEQVGKQLQVHDAGWAYGAALVDLDNDGWLDLHALAGFTSRSRDEPDG